MKKIFNFIITIICSVITTFATNSSLSDTTELKSIEVVSLYRHNVNTGSLLKSEEIQKQNHGQEPSFMFAKMPSIYAYNDAATNFGYSYFRIRGMGQERMNVTLDGMPWNEAEDFGCYFSNAPDLLASMHSVKVERGASVTNNGTAAYAGNITLESVNLKTDTVSYMDMGAGSFNSYRMTGVYNMGIKNKWGLHVRGTMIETDGYKEHSYNSSQAVTVKTGYFFNNTHSLELLSITGQHRNGQAYIGVTKDELPKHLNPFKQIKNGCAPQETDNFFMTVNKLQYNGHFKNTWLTASLYWNHLKGDYRCLISDEYINELWNYDLNQHLYGGNVVTKWYIKDFTISGGVNAYMFHRRHIGTQLPVDTIVKTNHGYGDELYNNIGYKPDVNVFATGTYTHKNWKFGATVQYRYTSLDYKVDKKTINEDVPFKHTWNFFNAGANVNYKTSTYGDIYARWNMTHREPSRVDMFGAEYFSGELYASTQAERVNDIELGYDFKYKKINANINLFYMKFNNEMVATGEISSQNGLPLHTQNNSYRTGVELSVMYNPFKTFNIIFNEAWSSNKIYVTEESGKSYKNNNTYSPDFIMYGEVNYKFKYNWVLGISTNYRTKMYVDISNEHTLNSAFTLNTYLTKEFKHVDVSLYMNNITNKFNTSAGYVADNIMYYHVDAPFNFYVNFKYRF